MSRNDNPLNSILGLSRPKSSLSSLPAALRDYLDKSSLPPITASPLNDFRSANLLSLGTRISTIPTLRPKPKGVLLKITPPAPTNTTELANKIRSDTIDILRMNFQLINAQKVPAPQEIATNQAKVITTSVLHVDMRKSSEILEFFDAFTALRIYKIFHAALVATARLNTGRVRTFAGDRIGVVFDLDKERPCSVAVKTAMLMEEMINDVVNPILQAGKIQYEITCGIGVDYGKMFVGKIGQSGTDNNDLAWVGKAMNKASKLADIPETGVYITDTVFNKMSQDLKKENVMFWSSFNHPEHGKIHKWLLKV